MRCIAGCALGGSALVVSALHLYKPLVPRDLLYAHAFITAGSVLPVRSGVGIAKSLFDSNNIRASAGVGVFLQSI
mgnify:CR=1 FL=1